MAATFDANASADVTSNAVTSITTSNLTVGSGTNRALIAQIVWSGTTTSPSANWDQLGTPQALAQVPSAAATNTGRVELWGLVNPTSGAKQLKVSWTTSRDVYVNQLSYTGVDQTGGATSFPHGTSATGTGNNPTASVTVTSATNNAVVAAHFSAGSFLSVNNTQTFLDNVAANASGAGNRAAGAATVTLTGSISGGPSVAWIAVGCDLAAVAVSTDTGEWMTRAAAQQGPRTINVGYGF
jgi:hypothetical protein